MEKLEFFKKYCKLKNIENRYGFGKIEGEKKYLIFINGYVQHNLAYEGKNIKEGALYRTSPATCGHGLNEGGDGSCEVGNYKKTCSAYSKNKCAVYFYDEIELDKFKYELLFEQIAELQKPEGYDLWILGIISDSD